MPIICKSVARLFRAVVNSKIEKEDISHFGKDIGRQGYISLLQWARARHVPLKDVLVGAAESGHLKVLQWAVASGCPYEEGMRQHVIRRHGEDAIQWKVQSLLSNHSHFGEAASDRPLLVDMWNAFFSGKS